VIPTYNRKESLLRTLGGLSEQTLPPDRFEVVVVSDGSTDGTVESVGKRSWPFHIKLLAQRNSGPSAARNHGARESSGQIIIYLDDDVEPVPTFLEEHVRAHESDSRLVLIGPQSMPPGEGFHIWIAWEHHMLERQYERFRTGEWQAGPN